MTFSLKDRHQIAWRVLKYLQANPWETQQAIAERTGVSITSANRYLSGSGVLHSAIDASNDRPARFALKAGGGYLVAIDIGAAHWRLAVENLRPDFETFRYDEGHGNMLKNPRTALREISTALAKRMREREIRPADVAGVVVGIPVGLHDDDRVRDDGVWKRFDPASAFKRELSWTSNLMIETDGGLGAFAELQAVRAVEGIDPETATIAYVKWSSKLSAAMVVRGTIHRGDGLAASFLHSPVRKPAPKCSVCGRPCTAQLAALETVFEQAETRGPRRKRLSGKGTEERAATLYKLAQVDRKMEAGLRAAGRALGHSIGDAANVMGTTHVVIGGAFKGEAAQWAQDAIREGFEERATPSVAAETKIWDGAYTGRAAIAGGLALCGYEFAVPLLYERHVLHRRRSA